jgi:predicted DNA-binding transcriptional regulator YafY
MDRLVAFSADELADLEAAITLMRRENLGDRAASLEGIAGKLRALMKPEIARRVEPDLEALIEAEGLAMRPGPRPRIRPVVLAELRHAIKAVLKVTIRHRNRTTGRLRRRTVNPYGFLYGNRHYLVAFDDDARDFRLFSLSNIEEVERTAEPFTRDTGFSLSEYAENSFGVFQEEPVEVVWRFTPEAASHAREFQFHPDQSTEVEPDGSLLVRFRAGGQLEMAWHLYKWGDQIEVLEPRELADLANGFRRQWPGLP